MPHALLKLSNGGGFSLPSLNGRLSIYHKRNVWLSARPQRLQVQATSDPRSIMDSGSFQLKMICSVASAQVRVFVDNPERISSADSRRQR